MSKRQSAGMATPQSTPLGGNCLDSVSICRVNTTYRRLCYRRDVLSQGDVLPPDVAVLGSTAAFRWCSPGRNDNTTEHASGRVLLSKRRPTGITPPPSTPLWAGAV
ncbi:MAG: hypothetical protein LBT00_10010 [Spirochaetaceae bacterium]|nr:hypothetical protein [Spirochaetaceae bacterium]